MARIRLGRFVLVSVALLAATGCGVRRYSRQAIRQDVLDAVKLSAGTGRGLHADLKITSLFHPGLGLQGAWRCVGLDRRDTAREGWLFPCGHECVVPGRWLRVFPSRVEEGEADEGCLPGASEDDADPLSPALLFAHVRRLTVGGPPQEMCVGGALFDVMGTGQLGAYKAAKRAPHPWLADRLVGVSPQVAAEQPFGFEAGLGLGVVTARLGFDPLELADLLATLLGWDALRDNASP